MLKYENMYEDCKYLQSVESFVKVYVPVAVTFDTNLESSIRHGFTRCLHGNVHAHPNLQRY